MSRGVQVGTVGEEIGCWMAKFQEKNHLLTPSPFQLPIHPAESHFHLTIKSPAFTILQLVHVALLFLDARQGPEYQEGTELVNT